MHDGRTLSIGTGYGVDGREFTNGEGRDKSANALDARVSISCIPGIQLIRITNPLQPAGST